VLSTRTGRPGDAPIPLCLCKTPAFAIPLPAQSPWEWLPDHLSPRPVEWFNGNWQDQDSGMGIGRAAPTKNGWNCRSWPTPLDYMFSVVREVNGRAW